MKKLVRAFLLLCMCVIAPVVHAQQYGPPPPPAGFQGPGQGVPMRELSPEQREQFREERRQRREAWQQMSPEERHQLRRDIRDAGQTLYPRGRNRYPE
jgi:Spy/CpxP family protein refolding chaperone